MLAVLVATVWLAGAGGAAAFHDGGVAACSGCHSMHNAGSGPGSGSPNLLAGGSASDICLGCHAYDFGAVFALSPLTPPPERGPGNFVHLLSANLNDAPDGNLFPIPGDAAGHNIRASGFGLAADGTHATSPGGTYPANQMKCTSCHDPHGNTNYRFLRGPGMNAGSGGGFTYPAPDATGLDLVLGGAETDANHVAYRGGVSRWCGNCHGAYLDFHNGVVGGFGHPIDEPLELSLVTQYNLYRGTADPFGGDPTTSYLAAVPFEDAGRTVTSTSGPTTASRVMCLSCHRAHATSAPAAGRWDFNIEKLGLDGVVSGSYPIPDPYGDPDQDPLCWKCHDGGRG